MFFKPGIREFDQRLILHYRNSSRSFVCFCLLVCISLSWPSMLWAQETGAPDSVNARTWSPANAEIRQKQALARQIRDVVAKRGKQAEYEARKKQQQRETGYGAIPHAPRDVDHQKEQLRQLTEIQLIAESEAAVTDRSVEAVMSGFLSDLGSGLGPGLGARPLGAATTDMILRTSILGPVTGGGWAYAFDHDTQSYLGFSSIGGGGAITLPVSSDQSIDIMVFPYAPFAFQVVRNVTASDGLEVFMQDAIEVGVTVQDLDNNILSGINTKVRLVLRSYIAYSWSVGTINGTGSIYLAPGEIYDALAEPEVPYLSDSAKSISSATPSVDFALEKGVTLNIAFNDPDGLLGQGGCLSEGSLIIYRSQDVLENRSEQLSTPTSLYDGSSNLIGFVAAVPNNVAIDYEVRFNTGSNWCSLQDYRQRLAWFRGENSMEITLKPRPVPNVTYKTSSGVDLPYSYGFFYPLDRDEQAHYFTASFQPSLIAGESYAVNVRSAGNYSVNEAIVTAQGGSFDVSLVSEPLTIIKGNVTVTSTTNVAALIELYQDSVLVEAFEYRGRELTMEIPAGTYDVRVSGITARRYDSSKFEYFSIFLKPFWVEKTFAGTGDERMDFVLDLPVNGISFALLDAGIDYQFTVLEGQPAVSSQVVYHWYDGILTDFEQLDLVIRGVGYHDLAVSATPAVDLPFVDIAGMQGTVGRLQGTVVDQADQPIGDVPIYFYAQDGVYSSNLGPTRASGEFDIPKVKNGLFIFNAQQAGESLMYYRPVGDAASAENEIIKVAALDFHAVAAGGSVLKLLYGRGYKIVFLAEGYTSLSEEFTDTNGNSVWDGKLFIDLDEDGLWDPADGEPAQSYGDRVIVGADSGTDITVGNESFIDQNGDGYPNINDFAVFVQNARNYVRALLGTPDIAANIEFDVYIVFQASQQAGVDVIDELGEKLIEINTLYDAAWRLDRSLLSIDGTSAHAALDSYVPDRDLTVVMINQPVRAGRANSFILANGGVGNVSPNGMVAGHEFGHNPGRLADEYDEFSGTSTSYFAPSLEHLTHRTDPSQVPWASYIGARTDLPISTPLTPGAGVYAGGSYNAGGAYRSTSNSRMRYSAPLFNGISLDVFSRSLCLHSLTESDFVGSAPGTDGVSGFAEPIFADGFESTNGSGVLTDLCN